MSAQKKRGLFTCTMWADVFHYPDGTIPNIVWQLCHSKAHAQQSAKESGGTAMKVTITEIRPKVGRKGAQK